MMKKIINQFDNRMNFNLKGSTEKLITYFIKKKIKNKKIVFLKLFANNYSFLKIVELYYDNRR